MKFLAVISSLESELWELDVLGRREENLNWFERKPQPLIREAILVFLIAW